MSHSTTHWTSRSGVHQPQLTTRPEKKQRDALLITLQPNYQVRSYTAVQPSGRIRNYRAHTFGTHTF